MTKIETSLENVVDDIREFYNETIHHFLTLNGIAIDKSSVEIQWIFSKYYAKDEVILFYTIVDENDIVPSIVDIIPSAIISQREIVDMFGIKVENSEKGLYLDNDSLQKPLSLGCEI